MAARGEQITIRFKPTANQHDAFSWLRALGDLGLASDENRRGHVVAVRATDWQSTEAERTVVLTVTEVFNSRRMPHELFFSRLEHLAIVPPPL